MHPILRPLIAAAALLALAAPAGPALAAWPNDPTANVLVAVGSTNFNSGPAAAPDGAGGAFIAYTDPAYHVYLARLDAHGVVRWQTRVAVGSVALGGAMAVAADGAGGAFVAWEEYSSLDGGVYAQRVSADGTLLWDPSGVPVSVGYNYNPVPVVVPDGAGGVVIAWMASGSGPGAVHVAAQRLDASGAARWTAGGVALSAPYPQTQNGTLRACTDGLDGAIAVWADSAGGLLDVRAQRVDAGGTPRWGTSGTLICADTYDYDSPSAASDGAGGVYVLFTDSRSLGDYGAYVQRLSASGAALWTAGGIRISPAEHINDAHLAPDGAGGAILTWSGLLPPASNVTAQRLDPNGTRLWGANGVELCATATQLWHPEVAPDGAGGGCVTWWDDRTGNWNLYAQRLDAVGTPQWTANGLGLTTAAGDQWNQSVVSDGAGGVIGAWNDERAGHTDTYAQRIDRWGVLGGAASLTGIHDVPADQGGTVELTWTRSPLDVTVSNPIVAYWIWRQVPASAAQSALARGARRAGDEAMPAAGSRGLFTVTSANGETYYWQYVGYALADGRATYDALVATACDSAPGGNPRTVLMVEARTSGGTRHWASAPDSGYSVDNLAPPAPTPFTGTYASFATALHWGRNPATDLGVYRLYRGGTPGFAVGPASFVVATPDTGYLDAAGGPYYYKVVAVDIHGNASAAAFAMPSGTADVAPGAPPAVALGPPAPNPFRVATTLRLALPATARVSLAVYDQQGRRVRTLADGALPAGTHALTWDGADDAGRALPSALYFLRLETPSRTVTRRVAVVR